MVEIYVISVNACSDGLQVALINDHFIVEKFIFKAVCFGSNKFTSKEWESLRKTMEGDKYCLCPHQQMSDGPFEDSPRLCTPLRHSC